MLRGFFMIFIFVCGGIVRLVGILDGLVWIVVFIFFGFFNGLWLYGYNVGWSGFVFGVFGVLICLFGGMLVFC